MTEWTGQLKLAARRLRRTPVFSVAAVMLLGVGMAIAAATATLLNAALFKAPAIERRLAHVAFWEGATSMPQEVASRVVADPPQSFARLAAYGLTRRAGVVAGGSSHRATIEAVSGHYFTLLEARPVAGRLLHAEELSTDALGAVLGEEFAARVFTDPALAVGSTVVVAGKRLTVVGVVRTPVRSGIVADLWVPSHVLPIDTVFGALQTGVTVERATAEVAGRYGLLGPGEPRSLMVRQGLEAPIVRPQWEGLLWTVSLALLISITASISFSLLLYARLVATQSDMAIRVALGATSRDLSRLLAFEVMILASAATWVAVWFGNALARFVLIQVEAALGWHIAADTTADWRIFLAVALVVLLVALVVVARLAWSLAQVEALGSIVAVGGMGGASIRTAGSSARLVLAQSAATATLLFLAVVITRSALPDSRAANALPTDGTVIAWTDRTGQPARATIARAQILRQAAAESPEFQTAALVSSLPGGASSAPTWSVKLADGRRVRADVHYVSAEAFRAMDRAAALGRVFTDVEDQTRAPVAVVGQSAAGRLWPGLNPVGKHVIVETEEGSAVEFTVVGEVTDAVSGDIRDAPRDIYVPFEFIPSRARIGLLVRSTRPAAVTADYMATSLQSAWPDVAFLSIRPLERELHEQSAESTAVSALLWVFGLIVFTVAMGGLYGLMAYLAAMRQREFGIRKALGATTPLLCRMLARETSRVLFSGVALGIAAGVMIGLLFTRPGMELRVFDPVAIFGVALGLYFSGLAGSILPYVRAMRAVSVRLRD